MKTKENYNTKLTDTQRIRTLAFGRETEILRAVAGISEDILDGKHHSCPHPDCSDGGGKDRFRHMIERHAGAVICNQCFNKNNGDFIAAVMWMRGCTFPEALNLIGDYLGYNGLSTGRNQASGSRFQAVSSQARPKVKATNVRAGSVSDRSNDRRLVRTIPYEYLNGAGDYHVLIERLEFDDGSKSFRQFHWDIEQRKYVIGTKGVIAVPFDAPSFKEASIIYWTEGEKAATVLDQVMENRKPEICCSCNWGGSNQFSPELVPWFIGKEVVIFEDNDQPGRKYVRRVASAIFGTAKSAKVVSFPESPEKYDIADWIMEESEVAA